eukprot:298059-Alexandrium_andersonii.AAC.1
MSASLVGSEMCIRDSAGGAQGPRGRVRGAPAGSGRPGTRAKAARSLYGARAALLRAAALEGLGFA